MAEGAGTNAESSLLVGDGTLIGLRKQLDKLLTELRATEATPQGIQATAIGDESAYGDFPGAQQLAGEQAKVQAKLEAFIRVFGEQIEALSIAAEIAERGYENVEAGTRARMHAIQEYAAEHHEQTPAAPTQDEQRTTGRDSIDNTY